MRELLIKKLSPSPQDIEKSNNMWDKRASGFVKLANKTKSEGYFEFFTQNVNFDKKSVIDISCGAARYLKLLLDAGANAEGLEPSKEMVRVGKEYLKEFGYEDTIIHNIAFQDFIPKEYDYVFISNSPVISYYENYQKLLKIAKKGIFIGSWLKQEDSFLKILSKELKIDVSAHGGKSLIYIFNLFVEDGYYPIFDKNVTKEIVEVNSEEIIQKYANWVYGPEYTKENVDDIRTVINKYADENGSLKSEVHSAKGMMYVDLEEKI